MNVSTSREDKRAELWERADRALRWSEGFEVCADTLEALSLPVVELEEVRAAVVARLRRDAGSSRREVEILSERVHEIDRSLDAAKRYHLSRP